MEEICLNMNSIGGDIATLIFGTALGVFACLAFIAFYEVRRSNRL